MPYLSFLRRLSTFYHRALALFRQGRLWQVMCKRIYSSSSALGLQRDLTKVFENPEAAIDISIRPLKDKDVEQLMDYGQLSQSHPQLAEYQRNFISSDLSTCYVAVTKEDEACYMQFLIGSEYNRQLRQKFGKLFPKLDSDEALLEAAYMRPAFRGKRIMPAAMSRIAARAEELGARWVITFVHVDNIPSLKGCKRAGFSPYILRKERWLFFRHFVSFHEIPPEIRARFFRATTTKTKPPAVKQKENDNLRPKPAIGTDQALQRDE